LKKRTGTEWESGKALKKNSLDPSTNPSLLLKGRLGSKKQKENCYGKRHLLEKKRKRAQLTTNGNGHPGSCNGVIKEGAEYQNHTIQVCRDISRTTALYLSQQENLQREIPLKISKNYYRS